MSESAQTPASSTLPLKLGRVAEYRRWMIVASILVIVETGVLMLAEDIDAIIPLFAFIWLIGSTGEAFVQLSGGLRRALWIAAGTVTGASLAMQVPHSADQYLVSRWLLVTAGFIESLVVVGVRHRPWIWLIATPVIYWQWAEWVNGGYEFIVRLVNKTMSGSNVSIAIPSRIPGIAAMIGIPLFVRAFLGSFIASRKTE